MDDRPSSAARSRTEPGLSAGLHFPHGDDPLRLLHREGVDAFIAGDAAVPAHVLEMHSRVDERIDRRIEVEILLALPRPREPVDDAEAVSAQNDSPFGIVTDARPDTQQRLTDGLQLLAIVGGPEVTADGFIDAAVRPLDAVCPGAGSRVPRAGAVGVRDHRGGHGARIRSQFAHCVSPVPVRTARRSSFDTGMWQPAQKSPASPVTAGRRWAAIRAYR